MCLSGKHEDLVTTDHAAMEVIDPTRRYQDRDNYNWIRDAEKSISRWYTKLESYTKTVWGE